MVVVEGGSGSGTAQRSTEVYFDKILSGFNSKGRSILFRVGSCDNCLFHRKENLDLGRM